MWPCAQLKLPLVLLVSWLDGATFEKGKKTKNKNNQRPNTFGICSVSQLGPNISKQWCGCLGSTKPAVMVMAINFNLSTRRFWSKSVLVTRLLHSHVQLTSIINLAQAQTELKYKSKYADARTTLYFPNHLGVNSLRRCSKEWRVGGSRVVLQTTHVPTKCSPATLRNKQVKNLNKVHWKGSSFFFFFKKGTNNKRQQINNRIVLKADDSPVPHSQSPPINHVHPRTCKYHRSRANARKHTHTGFNVSPGFKVISYKNVWQVLGSSRSLTYTGTKHTLMFESQNITL